MNHLLVHYHGAAIGVPRTFSKTNSIFDCRLSGVSVLLYRCINCLALTNIIPKVLRFLDFVFHPHVLCFKWKCTQTSFLFLTISRKHPTPVATSRIHLVSSSNLDYYKTAVLKYSLIVSPFWQPTHS